MRITNHITDPYCSTVRVVWRVTAKKVGEHYQYARANNSEYGAVHVWGQLNNTPLLQVNGNGVFAAIRFDDPSATYTLENCRLLSDVDDGNGTHYILATTSGGKQNKSILMNAGQPFTLLEAALYSAQDLAKVQTLVADGSLETAFIAGDTLPLN